MCMINEADGVCEVYQVGHHVARKEHRCLECNRTIAKGEIYRWTKSLSDGRWWLEKSCVHCEVAIKWLEVQCGGTITGMALEDIEEHIDEYQGRSMLIARLYVGMKRSWLRYDRQGLMKVRPVPPKIEETTPVRMGSVAFS